MSYQIGVNISEDSERIRMYQRFRHVCTHKVENYAKLRAICPTSAF
jgi:hypothetical protein